MAAKDCSKTTIASDENTSQNDTPVAEKSLEQSWTLVVSDPMTMHCNALGGDRPTKLLDCDKGVPYYCLLKKQKGSVERYLLGDWYEYTKEANLKVGDTLHFGSRYPPVDEIFLSVEQGNEIEGWRSR